MRSKPCVDELSENYDPSDHRDLEHPTSRKESLIHLLKITIDSNFLAMPLAFKNAGFYMGLFGSTVIGFICTYCVHMLLHCSRELCCRLRVPSMEYSEVGYNAFDTGPRRLRKFATSAK